MHTHALNYAFWCKLCAGIFNPKTNHIKLQPQTCCNCLNAFILSQHQKHPAEIKNESRFTLLLLKNQCKSLALARCVFATGAVFFYFFGQFAPKKAICHGHVPRAVAEQPLMCVKPKSLPLGAGRSRGTSRWPTGTSVTTSLANRHYAPDKCHAGLARSGVSFLHRGVRALLETSARWDERCRWHSLTRFAYSILGFNSLGRWTNDKPAHWRIN